MVPEMLFSATAAIGFTYGVTWNTDRRSLFNWKHEEVGNLEAKVKSFCAIPQQLRFLRDFILFAEKDEELQKYILRQHQTAAVEHVVDRASGIAEQVSQSTYKQVIRARLRIDMFSCEQTRNKRS